MALTHRILKKVQRPWGWEARVEILDGTKVLQGVTPNFGGSQPSDGEVDAAMVSIKARLQAIIDYNVDKSDLIDGFGPEVKEAILWVIVKVRENPGATIIQAENAWNAEWSDSLFDFDRLVTFFRNRVSGSATWDQFKTYVINHNFDDLDSPGS